MNGKRASILVIDELPSLLPYQRDWIASSKIVVVLPGRRGDRPGARPS